MSFFNQTQKTVNVSTSQISDPNNLNQIRIFSKNISFDLILLREYVNTVMYPMINTLTSKPRYPKDVLEAGLSGETIVTWLEAQGNSNLSSSLFWDQVSARPKTIKESFDYLSTRIGNSIIQNITNVNADLESLRNELLALINDVSNMAECNRDNITRIVLDVFGPEYIINCDPTATLETPILDQITNLKAALGFNLDGTKPDFTSTNYISTDSTVLEAINILDEQLKLVADNSGGGPIDDSTYAKKPESNTFVSTNSGEILLNKFVTDVEVTRGDFRVIKEASSNFYLYIYTRYGLDQSDAVRLQLFTTTDNGATRTVKSTTLPYDSTANTIPYNYSFVNSVKFIKPASNSYYLNSGNNYNIQIEAINSDNLYLEVSTLYDTPVASPGYPNDIEFYLSKSDSATPDTYLIPFTLDDDVTQDPRLTKIYKINTSTLATTLTTDLLSAVTYENEAPSFSSPPESERLVLEIDSSTGVSTFDASAKIKFKTPTGYSSFEDDNKIIFNSDATENTSNNTTILYKRGENSDRYFSWKEYSKRFETNQTAFIGLEEEIYTELFFSYNSSQVDLDTLTFEIIEWTFGDIPKRMPLETLNPSCIEKKDSSYDHEYKFVNSPYSNSGFFDALCKININKTYYIKLTYTAALDGGVLQITMQKQNQSGIQKTIYFNGSSTESKLLFTPNTNSLNVSYADWGSYVENASYESIVRINKISGFNEQKSILLNANASNAESNASIEVSRGSSERRASIKWNEEIDKWQFYPALENALPGGATTNDILAWDDSGQPQWKKLSTPFVFHTRMDRFNYTLINGLNNTTSYSQDRVSFEGLGNTTQLFSYRSSIENELAAGQIDSAVFISLWEGSPNALYSPPYFAVYTNKTPFRIVIENITVNTEIQSDTSIKFVPVTFNTSSQVLYERNALGDYPLFNTGNYLTSFKFAVSSNIAIDNGEWLNGYGHLDFSWLSIGLDPNESIALVMLEIGGKSQLDTYFKPYVKGLNITYSGVKNFDVNDSY